MEKPNIFALPVPRRRVETRTFTDILQPGPNEPALLLELEALTGQLLEAEEGEQPALREQLDALAARIESERPVRIQLTLQAPDYSAGCVIREQSQELVEAYCTGKDGQKPKLYPSPDGKPYKLHRDVWTQIGGLMALQPSDPKDQPEGFIAWKVHDLLAIQSRMPNAFREMTRWGGQLMHEGLEPAAGNSAGATLTS